MEGLKDTIRIRKICGRIEISINKHHIDRWGKSWYEFVSWDSFASKKVWEREKDKEIRQMANCGHNIF